MSSIPTESFDSKLTALMDDSGILISKAEKFQADITALATELAEQTSMKLVHREMKAALEGWRTGADLAKWVRRRKNHYAEQLNNHGN